MEMVICRHCGQPVAPYYVSQGLCDDCKWDTWIPEGYEKKERYLYDPAAGHCNRTVRPLLGVPFLDAGLRQVNLDLVARLAEGRKRLAVRLLGSGLPEIEVARQMGVHQGTVSRWRKKIKKI
jgi:hypothetical protein